jgi:predicted  nucleic acid-binding Zn-ribbon protein
MGATLEALLALQDIEHQIVDIQRQLAARRRGVARQTANLRAAEQALEAGRGDLKHTQVEMDAVDLDLKTRSQHVSKLRDNLNTVRTNKEYAAVLAQLNTEKADVTRLEGRAIELLGQVEEKRKALGEQEAAVTEHTQRLENLKSQLGKAEQSFSEHLTALQAQRDEAAAKLDDKVVEQFNRLSERYDGEAMARVIQVHPRRQEYLCEGCNMSVTIERANALMSRDEVVTCGSCGRILHLEQNT